MACVRLLAKTELKTEIPIETESRVEDLIPLGKTDIRISRTGLGTWQWGDRMMWSYGKTHTDRDLREAFQATLDAGINFLDTAEVYGKGRSERLLGEYLREARQPPSAAPLVVASKFNALSLEAAQRRIVLGVARQSDAPEARARGPIPDPLAFSARARRDLGTRARGRSRGRADSRRRRLQLQPRADVARV